MKKPYSVIAFTLFSISLVAFASSVFAQDKPERCPDVSELKKTVFNPVYNSNDRYNVYVASRIDTFGTNMLWAFGIGVPVDQTTEEDAMNVAVRALATLRGNPVPRYLPSLADPLNFIWICSYKNDYGYYAIASPATTPSVSEPAKMPMLMVSVSPDLGPPGLQQ